MAKFKTSKILAGFLALVMIVGMFPINIFTNVFASEIDSYSVRLTDGETLLELNDVKITMTDKKDERTTSTVKTVDGTAVFENFAEEGETYVVSVADVFGYEAVADFEITVANEEISADVVMTALAKISVSGIVTDENGVPYEGAKVVIGGYVTCETTTDAEGKYAFSTYAEMENTIDIFAKTTDKKYGDIHNKATYNADNTDANYQFSVRTFSISTTATENGSITESIADISYGEDCTIKIKADNGYRIEKLVVNGKKEVDAMGEQTYDLVLKEITENYDISVSFYRMTYKITFTVDKNGDVTYEDGDTQTVAGGSVSVEKVFNESVDPDEATEVAVTATPNKNYRVSKVTIDGNEESFSEKNYEYKSNHTMDQVHTFSVEFTLNEYSLTVECGENGEATWDKTTVKHGEGAKLSITPKDGYQISNVTVNGKPTQATEDETGLYIKLDSITDDVTAKIEFSAITQVNPEKPLINDYYKISFSKDPVKKYYDDDGTYVVVLPNDATATITPVNPYKEIKCNSESAYFGGYDDKLTLEKTEIIKNVYVKTSLSISQPVVKRVNVTANVKIIIDKTAPQLTVDLPLICTKEDLATVTGKVSDSGGSGINRVVYSKGKSLGQNEVLSSQNKAEITDDGKYSFESEADEQNVTYYIYAVDNAGNISSAKTKVLIDKTEPKIIGFAFSTKDKSIDPGSINFTSYGTFYNNTMYLTVYAEDSGSVSSGVNSIELHYFCGEDDKCLQPKTSNETSATFELTEDIFKNKVSIYAVVTDNAGNKSAKTDPKDEGLTNNQASINSDFIQITVNKPEIEIVPDKPEYSSFDGKNWYNSDVKFKVNVKDKVTGIKSVEIKINGQTIEQDLNGVDFTGDFSTDDEATTGKIFTVSTSQLPEELRKDGENLIEVVATSVAGQESEVTSEKVYIDTTKASVVEYSIKPHTEGNILTDIINFLTFGIFYNKRVNITVTAADKNASAGIKSITLYLGGKKFETSDKLIDNTATFIVTAEELKDNVVFAADISAKATDNVGNITEKAVIPTETNSNIKNSSLMIENVKPTATIATNTVEIANKNEATKDENAWYPDDIEFTVNTADDDSGIRNVLITINDTKVIDETFDNGTEKVEKMQYIVATNAEGVKRAEDGSYTVVTTVTDNAGNVFESDKYVVYKDIDDPYITNFDFQATEYVEENENVVDKDDNFLVVTTDYGFYFKADTDVIITAKDVVPTAGIKSITYYTIDFTNDANGVKSVENTVLVDENNQIVVKIPANFKGQIYAKATDNVLNVTDKFVNPNSAIVETQEKHDSASYDHIVFSKATTTYTANDGTELYADDVDVTITVEDTYSGIREIEWSVVAPYDTENNQSGKVTLNNDKSVVEGTEADWSQLENEINLVTKMQKTVKVNNNSNNIVLTVKMTDRAGNTTTDEIEFSIDKTDPEIEIVYGDKEVHDDENTDFFSTKRTATITVTERNFRASDIVFAITNTDRTIPAVNLKDSSAWVTVTDSSVPDNTVHVATVKYNADGDYTFDISYKDNAENPANKIATHKFTIDMTKPKIHVVYDNDSALNGNYYNADRTATITINEHNFDASRVKVMGVATDNGVPSVFPAISVWNDNGNDTYTATISYTADSKYTFDIEFRDKANNSIDDYTPETFYIDKTAPDLSITGVADKSANNGEVAPIITYSDTNFNKDAVSITLSGINNGDDLKYAGSYEDITNGQIYKYANFEKIQTVDDIYTLTAKLTDMAGNVTETTITFSANRFGSVYDLTGLKNIVSKYLKSEKDIVFTETNVDALERDSIKIKLTKNGTPFDLVEGTDYDVKIAGGNGNWSVYTYTIKKALFADDGRYSIAIYSKDTAGNVNENIDETKSAEISFGIDKTNPVIVPVDFESGVQYAVDMKTVSVEIKDNLVLEGVKIHLNGKEVEYTVNGETYTFDIPKANSKQNVKIVATDAAGNEETVQIEEFLVNANIFVRWYNNTPLFIGSIIGVVALAVGIIGFVVFGRKKKEEKQDK